MSEASKSPRRRRKAAGKAGGASVRPVTVPRPAAAAAEPPVEARSMGVVMRALMRAQARALVYERLAIAAADLFRGNDFQPPRLLLKVPGAGAFPVEIEDVMEVERELARTASDERLKIARLMGSAVLADPAEVDLRGEVPRGPNIPTPDGEAVVPNPAARPTAAPATTGAGRAK